MLERNFVPWLTDRRLVDIMMLSIINNNREALLSISGTRLWSGQNAQGYNCMFIPFLH